MNDQMDDQILNDMAVIADLEMTRVIYEGRILFGEVCLNIIREDWED